MAAVKPLSTHVGIDGVRISRNTEQVTRQDQQHDERRTNNIDR
jgi:hypothetical protein